MDGLGLFFIILGLVSLVCGFVVSYLTGTPLIDCKRQRLEEQKFLPIPSSFGLWRERLGLRRAKRLESELARRLRPQLYSNDWTQVLEAAQVLGAMHDRTAVPAMMEALESCVTYQPTGWREIAVALTNALAEIGDSRSLTLLHRLENVRGIGLISNIRHAIATIEPQTNLLRADYSNALPEHLLRPAQSMSEEPEQLLRSISGTEFLV